MYKLIILSLIIFHAIVWVSVPYNTLYTVGLDPTEMVAWGRALDFGYHKHPPLPSVIVIGLLKFMNVNLAVFVSSQMVIVFTALGVWVLAKKYVSESSAVLAVALLYVLPYTTWISPEWNHNIVQMPFWVWSIIAFQWICDSKGKNISAYALLAGVSAIGLYGKYSMGILYISLFLYAVLWCRYILRFWGMAVFTVIFVGVLTPHILWLQDVSFLPFTYAQEQFAKSSVWGGLGSFWGALIASLLFVFLGILIAHRKAKYRSLSVPLGHFLVYITIMPLVVVTVVVVLFDISIHSRWGYAFLSTAPLMLLWLCEKRGYRLSTLWGVLWVVIINSSVAGYYAHYYTKNYNRGHYPARPIAHEIQLIWYENMGTKLSYVAGNQWTAGTVSAYAPHRPKLIVNNDVGINHSIDFKHVQQTGYMYIWRPDETPNVKNFSATGTLTAQSHPPHNQKTHKIKWGIVAPKK